ncbi:MAG: hypothetical protein QME78_17155 [Thermodesulfobacteriota bacterium]|nr:hypothetical protein [Thermodesulfobacteriota bacterium]
MNYGNKVLLEIRDKVALITLNKPERLNALDIGVWKELMAAAEVLISEDARGIRSAGIQKKGYSFKGR